MAKVRPLEVPPDHPGYQQRIQITLGRKKRLTFSNAFFTVDWKRMLLEVYSTVHPNEAFNLGNISSITVHLPDKTIADFVFEDKEESVVDDDTIQAAYARQPWTNGGTIHLHKGPKRRSVSKLEKLGLASLLRA